MDYIQRYVGFLKGFLKVRDPISIVIDPSNGSTGPIFEKLFPEGGLIRAHIINSEPDGNFPAHGPNPMKAGALDDAQAKVLSESADLGVVLDGDGDRAIFIDNEGARVDPIDIFYILYKSFDPPYVVDLKALIKFASPELPVFESKTGYPFIRKLMRENGASLGIERSGHYHFKDFFNADSCIFATVWVVNRVAELKERGESLHSEIDRLPKLDRPEEINWEVKNVDSAIQEVKDYYTGQGGLDVYSLDGVSVIGEDFGLNLRESNTEPLTVRLNVVTKNEQASKRIVEEVQRIVQSH